MKFLLKDVEQDVPPVNTILINVYGYYGDADVDGRFDMSFPAEVYES